MDSSHVEFIKTSSALSNSIYDVDSEHLVEDPSTDAQARIHVREEATYVVFRGSESRTDWVMNIMFRFMFEEILPESDARAHSGFVYQWHGVRDEITKLLEDHELRKPLVVCGHSLGGAVATVAALELRAMGYTCVLVTYGSPRALNWTAQDMFDKSTIPAYRVTNGADVVTMVPIFMLHHVGKRIECNAKSWWYLVSIRDHSMDAYAAWGADLVNTRDLDIATKYTGSVLNL